MPSLTSITINIQGNDGERYSMTAKLFVNNIGIFSLFVPQELEEICKQSSDNSVRVEQDKKYLKLKSENCNECVEFMRKRMYEYFNFEKKVETVIRYAFDSDYSISEDTKTGEFYSNGSFVTNPREGFYKHCGNLHACNGSEGGYSIQLYADVLEKISFIRKTSTKVIYGRANIETGTFAEKLQGFVGCLEPGGFGGAKIHEIPYTEGAAEFFYNALLGIAKIAHMLSVKFSTKESVLQMIQKKDVLMLAKENNS